MYINTLRAWAESSHSHPFLHAVLNYVEQDLVEADLKNALGTQWKYKKEWMVCWWVEGIEGEVPACWNNQNLINAATQYYYGVNYL